MIVIRTDFQVFQLMRMVALITVIETMNRAALPHSPTEGRVCRQAQSVRRPLVCAGAPCIFAACPVACGGVVSSGVIAG